MSSLFVVVQSLGSSPALALFPAFLKNEEDSSGTEGMFDRNRERQRRAKGSQARIRQGAKDNILEYGDE